MGKRTHQMVNRTIGLILFSILLLGLMPTRVRCEFFKYVDENGKVHYVDDISRIPPKYREELKVYKDRFDDLSDSEKRDLIEREARKSKKLQQEIESRLKEAELRRLERAQKSNEGRVTEVVIVGNHVLMSTTIGYGRKEVTVKLVLDTGAEIIVLHEDVAKKLNIKASRKGAVKVAGGKKVDVGVATLGYVQVGPHRKADIYAVIMKPEGRLHYDGLLGMNFLKDLQYTIDFENQLVRWQP